MISLYGGRLRLVNENADRTWHAVVVLGPRPEHQLRLTTGVRNLREALPLARVIFHDAQGTLRGCNSQVMCWDCVQWNVDTSRCSLGVPECRRSGGRYAPRCSMFHQAISHE